MDDQNKNPDSSQPQTLQPLPSTPTVDTQQTNVQPKVIQPSQSFMNETQIKPSIDADVPDIPANQSQESPPQAYVSVSEEIPAVTSSANPIVSGANSRRRLFIRLTVAIIIIFVALCYLLLLPQHWDSQYSSTITPLYSQQQTKMLAAYESFSQPVFTSNNTTTQSDDKNYAVSNSAIQAAMNSTSNLEAKNHLTVLPLTTLFGSTKSNKQYNAMKQYARNSQAFLSDYKTLVTYMNNFEQIGNNQFPQIGTDIQAIGASKTPSQLLSSTQDTSDALSAMITTIKALNPPTDLKQFNTTILQDLGALNTALEGMISGINGSNPSLLESSAAQFSQAATNLLNYTNTDLAGLLQKGSVIHQQIVNLESENPIGTKSTTTINTSNPNNGTST